MLAEFKHTLRRMLGRITSWGIMLFLWGWLAASFFPFIQKDFDKLMPLVENYPPEIMAFFGDFSAMNTLEGYLDVEYYPIMPLVVGLFVISAGAGLLGRHEEEGVLDLVISLPISRSSLFWGRVLGFVAALAVVMLAAWLGLFGSTSSFDLNVSGVGLLQSFLPLFMILLLFSSLGLLFSMFMPSARTAGMLSLGLLFANFLLNGMANLNENLKTIMEYTPLHFFQGGDAITALNWSWLGGLLAVSAVLVLLAWRLFMRRDIRVSGEGSWGL